MKLFATLFTLTLTASTFSMDPITKIKITELEIGQIDSNVSRQKNTRLLIGAGIAGGCMATYKVPHAVGFAAAVATMGSSKNIPLAAMGVTALFTGIPTMYLMKKFYDTTKTIDTMYMQRDAKINELQEFKNK